MSERVLDMDDVEATDVSLSGGDHTHTTQVVATGDHAQRASLELDKVHNLAGGDVVTNGIVHLDQWVRIADGATIVRHKVRNAFRACGHLLHAAQLVLKQNKTKQSI